MNDPGLDSSIDNTARDLTRTLRGRILADSSSPHISKHDQGPKESLKQEVCMDEEEEDIGYFGSKRWWFTSTAFPLVAGTFGPLANFFSVCALVQTWRILVLDDNGASEGIKDPAWLIILNSISLVFALAANILLLFNFAHRVRYAVAQPLTITLWYLSSILLLVPLALTHRLLRIEPLHQHPYSQSYFYGIISAVLYFIISSLLTLNLFGAKVAKAYPPSFNTLTIPQRTLMLQTIAYSLYLAAGAGIFAGLEGWEFVDGVYWADYTLLTIGLGTDFPLQTAAAKALLIPYAIGGITAIGLIIGSIRGLVVERGKTKMARRALGEERERRMEVVKADGEWLEMAQRKERKWLRREFEMMRAIEKHAGRKRKAWALGASLGAFLLLWLGGAMVFTFSESAQSWSYPTAAYFAYVALLTIGYGDFYPQSNAGKPFFVLWSLLAIPTVTVLISSAGDTVVHWIRSGTFWLAKRTILPEENNDDSGAERPRWTLRHDHSHDQRGIRDTRKIQDVAEEKRGGARAADDEEKAVKRGVKWREQQDEEVRGTGNRYSASADADTDDRTRDPTYTSPDRSPATGNSKSHGFGSFSSALSPKVAKAGSDSARLLAHAIRHIARDVGQNPPRRYDWEEWEEIMGLFDESGIISHSATAGSGSSREAQLEPVWTFLADDGPLLSRGGEAEWVLERLCKQLEESLACT